MNLLLLTGAGFSRNWGGWLADEAFEYLLGCPEVDDDLRRVLWASKNAGGGFEDALAALQERQRRERSLESEKLLRGLRSAVISMFNNMNQSFGQVTFEPQQHIEYLVRTFLVRFDAIFTLNQDLLKERHYLDGNILLGSNGKWNGWQLPGTKPLPSSQVFDPWAERTASRTPDESAFRVEPLLQPYFKLHGSSNWETGTSGNSLLVVGGHKALDIDQHPLLSWYHKTFRDYLSRPDTRLVVIGYSFSDRHINDAITDAAAAGSLKLFIVDPRGVDVLDKQGPQALIRARPELVDRLSAHIYGASRRPLISIFGGDVVEHTKLMRFITP